MAREGAVTRESGDGGEIVLRVAARGKAIAPTVVLYPDDGEWDCDCGGRAGACAHVAAAVIALTQDQLDAGGVAELRYRFARGERGLVLRRTVLATGAPERELPTSLMAVASGRARDVAAGLRPTQADLEVDRLLTGAPRSVIAGEMADTLLSALAGCDRITLDGQPVGASGERVLPRGAVTDRGDGVRLAVMADPAVDEVPGDGVGLCHGVLHPLGHTLVAGARWELLPLIRDYAPEELGELVTQMLPALRRDVEVEVRSRRLPRSTREARPRIQLEVTGDGQRISVLPTLVYGDPVLARIDGDRLVQLRPPAPVRDRRAEADLLTVLRDELNMVPGRRVTAAGAEARALTERVRAYQRGDDPHGIADAIHEVALVPHLSVRDTGDAGDEATGAEFDLWFDTSEPVRGEVRRASAAAVVAAWQNGLDLLPLEGGGWAPLPADFLARHGHRVLSLLSARGEERRRSAPAVVPSLARLCDALDLPRPRAVERLAALLEPDAGIPTAVAAGRLHRSAAPLPGRRRGLAVLPAPGRPRRGAGRRHGPGQDGAGAGRARAARAGRLPDQRAAQLGRRDRPLPPRPVGLPLSRPAPRARPGRRRDADQLRAPAQRSRRALRRDAGTPPSSTRRRRSRTRTARPRTRPTPCAPTSAWR